MANEIKYMVFHSAKCPTKTKNGEEGAICFCYAPEFGLYCFADDLDFIEGREGHRFFNYNCDFSDAWEDYRRNAIDYGVKETDLPTEKEKEEIRHQLTGWLLRRKHDSFSAKEGKVQ